MRHNRFLFAALGLAAVLMLTATCSQEENELEVNGSSLEYGKYPLVITADGMSAVAVPVTRATVDGDWDGVRSVAVEIGRTGDTGKTVLEYSVTTAGADKKTATLTGSDKDNNTYYWQSTGEEITVRAWHPYSKERPTTDNITVKADQGAEANYEASDVIATEPTVMRFSDATHSLTFSHLTAKIAVRLTPGDGMNGEDLDNAAVTLLGLEGVENEQTSVNTCKQTTQGEGSGASGTTTWHLALIRPQTIASGNGFIQVTAGGNNYVAKFDNDLTFEANTAYTYDITVNKTGLTLTGSTISDWNKYSQAPVSGTTTEIRPVNMNTMTAAYPINDDGFYRFTGRSRYPIEITGGRPTIYLDEVSIDAGGIGVHAINITGGASPTIHVQGENELSGGTAGLGINVAANSSVTIAGGGRDNSKLTARADKSGGGIGGESCGDITIRNITVYAHSGDVTFPGIGGRNSCGTITIDDATVYAYGYDITGMDSPAIGVSSNDSSVPDIIISKSVIHAYRGGIDAGNSYADWIGKGGKSDGYAGGKIQYGDNGSITSTTVHKWTRYIDTISNINSEYSDGVVEFDNAGNSLNKE